MLVIDHFRQLSSRQFHAFVAAFLGWTLDSFDYFLLIFCVPAIATEFHTVPSEVMKAVLLTQLLRPVGALLFGYLADRYGRKPVLMVNIFAFSLIEIASSFAPSLGTLLTLRALFGIAMGGIWGVGAALVFETLPTKGRGTFSGILQEGYAMGSLLAAAAFGLVYLLGWRGLFLLGAAPLLLIPYIAFNVNESPLWVSGVESRAEWRKVPLTLPILLRKAHYMLGFLPTFLFLILLMTVFMSFSHGTQDVYPTFLQVQAHLTPKIVSTIGIVYGIGSVLGGFAFGTLSEKWGRKRAIFTAALLAIPMIPLYAYGHSAWTLGLGSFLMLFMVQGAWGVIPAYLTELTPAPMRATAPGLAYQIGGLITAWNAVIQARAAEHWESYSNVLAITVVIVAVALAIVVLFGRESRGQELLAE
jgi:SHS family lactate transporter-like MFS transporter